MWKECVIYWGKYCACLFLYFDLSIEVSVQVGYKLIVYMLYLELLWIDMYDSLLLIYFHMLNPPFLKFLLGFVRTHETISHWFFLTHRGTDFPIFLLYPFLKRKFSLRANSIFADCMNKSTLFSGQLCINHLLSSFSVSFCFNLSLSYNSNIAWWVPNKELMGPDKRNGAWRRKPKKSCWS